MLPGVTEKDQRHEMGERNAKSFAFSFFFILFYFISILI